MEFHQRRWLAMGPLIVLMSLSTGSLRGAVLTFGPTCDNGWQTCCSCMTDKMCINWDRPPTPEPICPSLPTTSDTAIVGTDCTILPPPAVAAAAGDLQQTAGTLTIDGSLTVGTATFDGTVEWLRGNLGASVYALLTANNGMLISGDEPKSLGLFGNMMLTLNGDSTWTGNGSLTISQAACNCSPAIIHITGGKVFDVQNDAPIGRVSFGLGRINNDGTLTKTVATGTSEWEVYLDNRGLVHVQSGTVRLTGNGEATGEFRTEPGATLVIATGNTMHLNAGASVTGGGETIVEDPPGTANAINVNDTVDIDRMKILVDATIGGTGEMVIHDLLTLEGCRISAPITVPANGEVLATGGLTSAVGDILVEGTIHPSSGSTLTTGNGQMTIAVGAVAEIEDGSTLSTTGGFALPIDNYGTVQKLTGAGTGTVASGFQRAFNHYAGALVHAASGTLAFTNIQPMSAAAWQADAGATITFDSHTAMDTGSTWTGGGKYLIASTSGAPVNLRIPDGVHLTPHDFQLGENSHPANIVNLNGTIGDMTVSGTFRLVNGRIDETNVGLNLIIPESATLSFDNAINTVVGGHLALAGTAEVIGSAAVFIAGSVIWDIEPTGVLDFQSDVLMGSGGGPNRTFNNAGTIVKSAGAGVSTLLRIDIHNTGTIRSESGTLFQDSVGVYTQTSGVTEVAGGTIVLEPPLNLQGGALQGNGSIGANVNNTGGTVKPGGSVGVLTIASNNSPASPAVAGNYTQGAGGRLEIELGGLNAGSEHDQLVVAATADLHGELNLRPTGGFIPQVGDSFVVLTANTVTNGFDSVTGPGTYQVTYPPGQVVVTVVDAPCSTFVAPDFDQDCDVDEDDVNAFAACASGPTIPVVAGCEAKDLDQDGDGDQADFSIIQRCYSGPDVPADPNCAI